MLKTAIVASVACYLVGVGIMFLIRCVIPITRAASKWELLYGPAITIASAWVIFGIVYMLMPKKK